MGSSQGEGRRVVVGKTEARRPVAVHAVAALARGPARPAAGPPPVLVAVAVGTTREARPRPLLLVTTCAGHRRMAAAQRITGPVVVEAGAPDRLPALGAVALGAARTERPRVRIAVAVAAASAFVGSADRLDHGVCRRGIHCFDRLSGIAFYRYCGLYRRLPLC